MREYSLAHDADLEYNIACQSDYLDNITKAIFLCLPDPALCKVGAKTGMAAIGYTQSPFSEETGPA
jgi:hypothetical protein